MNAVYINPSDPPPSFYFIFILHSYYLIIHSMLRQWSHISRRFSTTIFDKILARQIPSQAVYEDELVAVTPCSSTPSRMWLHRHQFMFSSSPKSKTVSPASLKYAIHQIGRITPRCIAGAHASEGPLDCSAIGSGEGLSAGDKLG